MRISERQRLQCLHWERVRNWKGQAEAAVEWLKEEPQSAEAHAWLGWAQLRLKQRKEARRSFQAALGRDPTWLPAFFGLAEWERWQQRPFAAQKILQEAAQAHPSDALVRARLAELALGMKDRAAAQRHAAEAVALAPGWVDGQALRIFAELPANELLPGQARSAVEAYGKLLGQDAENQLTWHYLLDALAQEGKDWGAVEEAARTVLRLDPLSRAGETRLLEALSHRRWEYRLLSWPKRIWDRLSALQQSRWAWPALGGWVLFWTVVSDRVVAYNNAPRAYDIGTRVTVWFLAPLMSLMSLLIVGGVTGVVVAGLIPYTVIYQQLTRREIEEEAAARTQTDRERVEAEAKRRRRITRVLPFGMMGLPWLVTVVMLLWRRDWTVLEADESACLIAIAMGFAVYVVMVGSAMWLLRRR